MHALLFNKFAFIFTVLSINLCVLQAQNQAKMTPAVYNEWRKITKVKLSEKAETVIYALEKELGDKTLCIYDKLKDTVKTFDRLNQAEVDISGDFVVFTHGMNTDSLRMLKRKKTVKDKLPVDSLSIIDVRSGKRNIIERVSSFTMPSEFSGSLAYLLEPKKEVKDTTKTEKTKAPICKDKTLIIRALASGMEDTILNVKDYLWANSNGLLSYSQCTGDSIASYQVGIFDVQTRQTKIIGKSFNEVAQFSWDKKGEKLAFLGLLEKSTLTKKPFSLYLFQKSDSNAVEIIKETNSFSAPEWTVSNDKKPYFSESGKRLYFGMTPPALVKDTMRLEDEIVNVEIWHHDNPLLYTQLETTLDDDKKRSYLAVYDIGTKVTRQVEDQEIERSKLSLKGDGKYALLTKTKPYQKSITWLGEAK